MYLTNDKIIIKNFIREFIEINYDEIIDFNVCKENIFLKFYKNNKTNNLILNCII
jgi:hypothetical protein